MRRRQTRTSSVWLAAFVMAALLAGGCGGGDQPASVSGRVLYNNKPVTSGTVTLLGENGKASDPGMVKADGTYFIAKAPAGKVKVSFSNPPPTPIGNPTNPTDPEVKERADGAARYVATPQKFGDANQSGLTLDLKAGKNENCDIILP